MSTERDTHFAGFAKLETEKICDYLYFASVDKETIARVRPYISTFLAQCAYDLVCYSVDETNVAGYEGQHTVAEIIKDIPDLTKWPVEPTEGN